MKKLIIAIIAAVLMMSLFLAGCGEKKILHCDSCGKEVKVKASSNMTEDWIILCPECRKKLDE